MAHHSLLIDTGRPNNPEAQRMFHVADLQAVRLLAAGLSPGEEIPVYVRVGSSSKSTAVGPNTGPGNVTRNDFKWAPLYRCGVPVVLTAESNEHLERIPGSYMVGAPGAAPTFDGDVNVSHDLLSRDYLFVSPYCGGSGSVPEPVCAPLPSRGVLSAW